MTDAQIELFMPAATLMMTHMATLPEETKALMAANRANEAAKAAEVEATLARFQAADTNCDGMLNHAEWTDYNDKMHLDRCAMYPPGWLPKPTEEMLKSWYDLLLTLDDKEEVTLKAI